MTPKNEKPNKATTGKQRPPRRRKPDRDAIAKRAHEISRSQGDGDDVANWLQAERELTEK